jgi:hypothetical protein
VGFFFGLIGNVIPGKATLVPHSVDDPARFVLVGVVLFAMSLYILVQSWRSRTSTERLPLPGLLIVFALLFDVTITVGRGGTGVTGAANDDRYLMANLILLAGIAIWALARIPTRRPSATGGPWRLVRTHLALAVFAIFLVVQVTLATSAGVTYGRISSAARINDARAFVNAYPSCPLFALVPFFRSHSALRDASEDHLGEYGPTTDRSYRELGPSPSAIASANAVNKKLAEITGKPVPPCFLPPIAPSSG